MHFSVENALTKFLGMVKVFFSWWFFLVRDSSDATSAIDGSLDV
jgi:hypothetical protein